MKSRGEIFDFTSGMAPAELQDPVAAVRMAAQALCVQLRPEHLPQGAADAAVFLEDFLTVVRRTCPDRVEAGGADVRDSVAWGEWVVAVRASVREVYGAYRTLHQLLRRSGPSSVPQGLARIASELIRWDLVDRQIPDSEVWAQLGRLFSESIAPQVSRVGGDGGIAAREYLRAIAYHSAALDQLSLRLGSAVCLLVDLSLPFLVLERGATQGALYHVAPPEGAVPVRSVRAAVESGWCYVPDTGVELLAELHGQFLRGAVPPALEGNEPRLLCDAAAHLRRLWSHRPPVRRFRRHLVDADLLVVRGYERVRALFEAATAVDNGAWKVTDLSRGGVGALVIRGASEIRPESGDLLAFRPRDGANWHLGIVRRVRFAKGNAEVGIETLSVRPALIRVDDGRAPVDLFFCDPVLRGEAVRIIAPPGAIREGVSLFVTADGKVSKLKPLEGSMKGRGFELRVYQVL